MGQCPFKWFAQRLLRLAEPEEAEEDVSPILRGAFYHKVLALTLERVRQAENVREAALAELERAFSEAEADLTQLPSWPLKRQEHLKRLRLILSSEDFLRPDGKDAGRPTS